MHEVKNKRGEENKLGAWQKFHKLASEDTPISELEAQVKVLKRQPIGDGAISLANEIIAIRKSMTSHLPVHEDVDEEWLVDAPEADLPGTSASHAAEPPREGTGGTLFPGQSPWNRNRTKPMPMTGVWVLTPEQQKQYLADKLAHRNMASNGSYTYWTGADHPGGSVVAGAPRGLTIYW